MRGAPAPAQPPPQRRGDTPNLHESKLEQAIINNLQTFLLELGKGFSFVARQKHIRFGDDDFYVDLVFYNYLLSKIDGISNQMEDSSITLIDMLAKYNKK